MWSYKNITRKEFESRKDFAEQIMKDLGAVIYKTQLPYENKTTTICGNNVEQNISNRFAFFYNNEYYRVDEVLFAEKPFIVIEYGFYDDLIKNTMIDADPFPYDLCDDEFKNEIEYILGIKPYPEL